MRILIPDDGEETIENPLMGALRVKDYKVIQWRLSGKIFVRYLIDDLLGSLAKDMRTNVDQDYDNVVVVYGGEGSGKSNLAWALCRAYDEDFSLKNYAYNEEDFKEQIRKDVSGKTIWMDEGSNIASNREWNTRGNKNIVLFMETMRSKGATFVVCIPTIDRLDIYLRENRARYLLHCMPMSFDKTGKKARGYFELKKRDPDSGKMKLIGYGEYPPMDPSDKVRYEAVKTASQEKITKKILDGDGMKEGGKYKGMYEDKCKNMDSVMLALYESGYDREGLMQLFGIKNKQTFANRLSKARARP